MSTSGFSSLGNIHKVQLESVPSLRNEDLDHFRLMVHTFIGGLLKLDIEDIHPRAAGFSHLGSVQELRLGN